MREKVMMAALVTTTINLIWGGQPAKACTHVVYIRPDSMVITGRTMDWEEDIQPNLYLFPHDIRRTGYDEENTVEWTSKYGSIMATGYGTGTCDGIDEKGLIASLPFLSESAYTRLNDTRLVMGINIWTQYTLDGFAAVCEAVEELSRQTFHIDAPNMLNGSASTLHMAITDETGNSTILEYINEDLIIHEGKEYQAMTNSPRYDLQLTVNDYWKEAGGLSILPGTSRSDDRFVCASFYIHAILQTSDANTAISSVSNVMQDVSVPFGITAPGKPYIPSTRWYSVSDQKNRIYYFESTLTLNLFWVDLNKVNFSPSTNIRKLSLVRGEIYIGDVVKDFRDSKSFALMFGLP